MRRSHVVFALALGLFLATGCSKSGDPQASGDVAADTFGPDKAVEKFLLAVRAGNEEQAAAMLTPMARQKTAEMNMNLPAASETAKFEVGEVEMVSDDGAHVASEWTDVDDEGQPHTDSVVWILRKEKEGWRVAGMAAKVFEDELPIILNFEDPEDMVRKQKLAEAEMLRRAQEENSSAAQAQSEPDATQKIR